MSFSWWGLWETAIKLKALEWHLKRKFMHNLQEINMLDYISSSLGFIKYMHVYSAMRSTIADNSFNNHGSMYHIYQWQAKGDGWHFIGKHHTCIIAYLLPTYLQMQGVHKASFFKKHIMLSFVFAITTSAMSPVLLPLRFCHCQFECWLSVFSLVLHSLLQLLSILLLLLYCCFCQPPPVDCSFFLFLNYVVPVIVATHCSASAPLCSLSTVLWLADLLLHLPADGSSS